MGKIMKLRLVMRWGPRDVISVLITKEDQEAVCAVRTVRRWLSASRKIVFIRNRVC